MKQELISHWINGQRELPPTEQYIPVYNPALGEVIRQVVIANKASVNKAVDAAKLALPSWSEMPVAKRAKIFFRYKSLLEKNLDALALLVSEEHGKLFDDAKGSVLRGLEVVELACNAPYLMRGWFSENVANDMDCYTVRQPVGVCVGITPFNFPAMIPLWMFPLALVCGNTFVLKPSEQDPSCPMKLIELAHEAGVPAGVLNLVNGDKSTVELLITHPDVAAVSFVGSSQVAKQIQQVAIAHGKRVQAFGSAKNHAVVMPDADCVQAAEAIVGAAYGSAGERCMALSAVIAIGDETADRLANEIARLSREVRLGARQDSNVEMGPLVNETHCQRVKALIQKGVEEGACLLVDGRIVKAKNYPKGYFLGASFFDFVKTEMAIYQQEIFGPVLVMLRVESLDEALSIINSNPYGNGTCIFTREGDAARYFSSHVQVGMVGVNVPIPVPAAFHAFGGWKQSVFADIGMHGSESIQFYTKLKTVTSRWLLGMRKNQFMMPTHE